MRMRTAVLVQPLLVLGLLSSGCHRADDGSDDRARPTAGTSAPSASIDRATRRAERCADLLADVSLTYRITATPARGGREIGLRMVLDNRSDARLAGSTTGVLRVSGPRPGRISWGGSSADELWQKPGTTTRREVWHDRKPPGWHPVGDRVTAFGFSTYTYAPGPGTVVCFLPATVVAPQGLVAGHASGRWTQESSRP